MSAFDAYVQAKYHGGVIPGGPTFTVIHDAETPLARGYADSIAGFFQRGPAAGTSAHAMVGPEKAIKQLPDNVVAYAAGPVANTFGWHLEQTGYARFTPAQWTTADGIAQAHRVSACLREIHDQWGIPKRWCTDDQLRRAAKGDRSQGGMTTHQQVSRVLGGTTHTDPETNYPRDLLLGLVLGTQGDDMPLSDADYPTFKKMTTQTWQAVWDGGAPEDQNARDAFTWCVQRAVKAVLPTGGSAPAQVDAAAVAAALAANQGFLAALAKAVNDDAARRLAS